MRFSDSPPERSKCRECGERSTGTNPIDLTRHICRSCDASGADELTRSLRRLERAITDEGPATVLHRRTANRHRAEWPTLWRAIDEVRAAARVAAEARNREAERKLDALGRLG